MSLADAAVAGSAATVLGMGPDRVRDLLPILVAILVWAGVASGAARTATPRGGAGRWRGGAGRWRGRLGALGWAGVAVGATVLLGVLVRLAVARWQGFHVDEPFSLLGARAVAEHGWPVLPSGALYLHGVTLSYLLAPLVRLGLGDLADLGALRLASVAAGGAAVWLAGRIARDVAGDWGTGVLAAALVALDPASAIWSGRLRMYAPLQALTLALAWVFLRIVQDGPTRRRLAAVVVLFWAAVLTHVGAVLLWPAMVVVAWLLPVAEGGSVGGDGEVGGASRADRRELGVALGLCLLAPLAVVGANALVGPDRPGGDAALPFVGDHLLDLGRLRHPSLTAWTGLFGGTPLGHLMPTLVAVLSGMAAGGFLTHGRSGAASRPPGQGRTRAVGALLALYWVPIVAVALLVAEPQPRYLVHIHPLGLVLVALVAAELWRRVAPARPARRAAGPVLLRVGACLLALGTMADLAGGTWLLRAKASDADYAAAADYVAARRGADDLVVTAMPVAAYLELGGTEHMLFLAGPADGDRVARYTLVDVDGGTIDRWVGADAVTSTDALCRVLAAHPGTWVVVDRVRLNADWAFAGPMAVVLEEATRTVWRGPGGVLVLRARPLDTWPLAARRRCPRDLEGPAAPNADGRPPKFPLSVGRAVGGMVAVELAPFGRDLEGYGGDHERRSPVSPIIFDEADRWSDVGVGRRQPRYTPRSCPRVRRIGWRMGKPPAGKPLGGRRPGSRSRPASCRLAERAVGDRAATRRARPSAGVAGERRAGRRA